jgi:hypothetical protein
MFSLRLVCALGAPNSLLDEHPQLIIIIRTPWNAVTQSKNGDIHNLDFVKMSEDLRPRRR